MAHIPARKKFITENMEGYRDCPRHNEGHSQFPHWLLEGLLSSNFCKNEFRIILLIARLTFGCHQEEAALRKADFNVAGVPQTDIKRKLAKLVDNKVICTRQLKDQLTGYKINPMIYDWLTKKHNYWKEKRMNFLIGSHIELGEWDKSLPKKYVLK